MLWPPDARFSRSAVISSGDSGTASGFFSAGLAARACASPIAQIDDFDAGHRAIVDALRQAQQVIAPAPRVGE